MENKTGTNNGSRKIEGIPSTVVDWNNDRTQRQIDAVNSWNRSGRCGTILGFTGVGKTNIGIFAMKHMDNQFLKKTGKRCHIVLIVPSEPILKQWRKLIIICGLSHVAIYTKDYASKNYDSISCDMLVIDEVHTIPTPSTQKILLIDSMMKLGLTATFERHDGKHSLLDRFGFGVVERITEDEGIKNGWTAKTSVYKVLCEVDCTEYLEITSKFKGLFEYFKYDMEIPMAILNKKHKRHNEILRDFVDMKILEVESDMPDNIPETMHNLISKKVFGDVMNKARLFVNTLSKRKAFINHHPKKIEITRMIISKRSDKKGITFFNSTEDAKNVGIGKVYTYQGTKKAKSRILSEFIASKNGVINTVKALNVGFDCPDIEYAIIAGFDSSKTNKIQRLGRAKRINSITKGKEAEVFYIVLKGTRDNDWFKSSIGDDSYKTILEEDLEKFLNGEEIEFAPNR